MPNQLTTTLNPLYGILVSHKSYHIGAKNLVKAHHVSMLASRVCQQRLPAELILVVADELEVLERKGVEEVWRRTKKQDRSAKFRALGDAGEARTGAEEKVRGEIVSQLLQSQLILIETQT